LKSDLSERLRDAGKLPLDVQLALERVNLRLGSLGRRIHWFATTGSTNEDAARLAESGAGEGTTIVAEAQTAGRGRYGRSWFSPPGAGLYMSVILKPAAAPGPVSDVRGSDGVSLLTLATGVAVAEAIHASTGLPAEIKWPNDILVGRRKLAGILTEAASEAGMLRFIIVGLGINLRIAAYPIELASQVTSIEAETSRPVDRGLIFAETLAAVSERYADLLGGRFDVILSAWRRLARPLGSCVVEWDTPGGTVRGRAEDIDEHGALLVRVGGKVHRIMGGEVRWV
jgi:BirA family biotin operon repressor/biotin-[acetyl-CoA-carboxylase] ligase